MGYLGYKPADKPLTSADITDGIIVNADIANSTIDLTTKVTGTLPTTKGGTGLAALGTANQVLAVNSGATALEYQAVSSDYVLLATTNVTSATASVSFDGYFSSTYKNYKIINSSVINTSGNQTFRMRFRTSNADVTAGNYSYASGGQYVDQSGNSGFSGSSGYNQTSFEMMSNYFASGFTLCNDITIFDPLGTNNYKQFFSTQLSVYYNGTYYVYSNPISGILTNALTALSGVSFFFTGGNITLGNFKLYGIK
jgi:hypothetical protein